MLPEDALYVTHYWKSKNIIAQLLFSSFQFKPNMQILLSKYCEKESSKLNDDNKHIKLTV